MNEGWARIEKLLRFEAEKTDSYRNRFKISI